MGKKPKIKYSFDFEALYKRYPNKEGKGRGLNLLQATIKSQAKYEEFVAAMDQYIALCASENRKMRYVKHWVTFVRNWTDYSTKNFAIGETTKKTILRSQAERILKGEL